MKKPLLYHYLLWVKTQISIGNAKIEKLKTWPHSKIILDQGHVLGNTNFSPGKQICVFTHGQCFFLRLNMTIVFFQINGENTNKKIIAVAYIKRNSIYVI